MLLLYSRKVKASQQTERLTDQQVDIQLRETLNLSMCVYNPKLERGSAVLLLLLLLLLQHAQGTPPGF